MTLNASARIQSGSGLVTASSFTASLPDPTTDGSTLLLLIGTNGGVVALQANTGFDPPWVQDGAHAGNWYMWRRAGQPAGETSWAITTSLSDPYYWRVEEWSGLSTIGQPDASSSTQINVSTLTCNTGGVTSGTAAVADVDDFAALAVFRMSFSGAAGWPAGRSYPAGWSEVDYLTSGTGTVAADFALVVAESYPGAAGSVTCTLTFDTTGGGSAPNSTDGWAVCYQPSTAAPPAGILTS